ncbi:RNA polymerase sigma factor [Parapedobacter sp. DT-150]|uniref:RNA polymerase sigma factor n=1 Tax=Parapedobacter sp. DT-150 TaxID=3396162 RepID=UPI003F19741E
MDRLHTQRLSDRELLHRLREGVCYDAFTELYERHWHYVYHLAVARTGETGIAQDITQSLFLDLWENRQLRRIDDLRAYLFMSVRNRVLNWIKTEHRKYLTSDIISGLKSEGLPADHLLRYRELMQLHERVVSSFTPSQQVIYRLRYQEDLNTGQIAEQLGISRKTVQNQLRNCVLRLRKVLTVLVPLVFALL